MKYVIAFCLLFLSSFAQATYCTNGATNYPACNNQKPPPVATPAPSPNAAATARADAVAKQKQRQTQAQGQSATGGAGGNGAAAAAAGDSAANSNSTLTGIGNSTDQSQSSFKALAISLPTPVFTPPLPMSTCPQANVDQSAVAVGFGLFSHAKGSVNTDNCTAIIIYNSFLAQCKYESAQQVLNMLTVKVLPDWKAQNTVNIDLTTKECVELLKPIPPANPVKTVDNYIYVEKPCAVAAVAKAKQKRKATNERSCKL